MPSSKPCAGKPLPVSRFLLSAGGTGTRTHPGRGLDVSGAENVDVPDPDPGGMGRGFFMHVNAEVIFYGGTDPRAKVTIDGHPVALSPGGTFRYHFIFPDGACEIPIVATSPDGVETRQATLRFERATDKTGHVDDTPQPPLGPPMGARG
jgi:hypothetical protein